MNNRMTKEDFTERRAKTHGVTVEQFLEDYEVYPCSKTCGYLPCKGWLCAYIAKDETGKRI